MGLFKCLHFKPESIEGRHFLTSTVKMTKKSKQTDFIVVLLEK